MNKKFILLPILALSLAGCGPSAPTDWTEDDKEIMNDVLGEVLPFVYYADYVVAATGDYSLAVTAPNGTDEMVSSYTKALTDAEWVLDEGCYYKVLAGSTNYLEASVAIVSEKLVISVLRVNNWSAADAAKISEVLGDAYVPFIGEYPESYTLEVKTVESVKYVQFSSDSEGAQVNALAYVATLLEAGFEETTGYLNGSECAAYTSGLTSGNMRYFITSFYRGPEQDPTLTATTWYIQMEVGYMTPWIDDLVDGETSIADAKALAAGDAVTVRGTVTSVSGTSFTVQRGEEAIYVYNAGVAEGVEARVVGDYVSVTGVIDVYNGLYQIKTVTALDVLQHVGEPIESSFVSSVEELTAAETSELFEVEVYYVSGAGSLAQGANASVICAFGYDEDTSEYTDQLTLRLSKYTAASDSYTVILNILNALAQGDVINVIAPLGWYNGAQLSIQEGATVAASIVTGVDHFVVDFFDACAQYVYGYGATSTVPDGFTSATAIEWEYIDSVYTGADSPSMDLYVIDGAEADVTAYDLLLLAAGWEYVDAYNSYVNYTTYEQLYCSYEAELVEIEGVVHGGVFFRLYPNLF